MQAVFGPVEDVEEVVLTPGQRATSAPDLTPTTALVSQMSHRTVKAPRSYSWWPECRTSSSESLARSVALWVSSTARSAWRATARSYDPLNFEADRREVDSRTSSPTALGSAFWAFSILEPFMAFRLLRICS